MQAQNQVITNSHILRELRYLSPNKMQEVLDFIRFLRQQYPTPIVRQRPSTQPARKLMDFAGMLKDSPNFNDNPTYSR